MRRGTPLEWSQQLGVGPDDLPAQTRLLVQGADCLDEAIIRLRLLLHGCPDRDLDAALLALERRIEEVAGLLKDLHREVLRELT